VAVSELICALFYTAVHVALIVVVSVGLAVVLDVTIHVSHFITCLAFLDHAVHLLDFFCADLDFFLVSAELFIREIHGLADFFVFLSVVFFFKLALVGTVT